MAAATGDVTDNGVSLNLSATNPELTNSMPAASLGNVMREQAKLKNEFRAVMEMLSAKHEQELRAKVLAEQEVRELSEHRATSRGRRGGGRGHPAQVCRRVVRQCGVAAPLALQWCNGAVPPLHCVACSARRQQCLRWLGRRQRYRHCSLPIP